MQKKSSSGSRPRIPPEMAGIQVNFCKKPTCANFGVPASQERAKGKGAAPDGYTVVSAGKGFPVLKCHACGEYPPLKSNAGIQEELERLSAYLESAPEPSCTNDGCGNRGVGISVGKVAYQSFGKTASGAKRYRCKACGTTFSDSPPGTSQRTSHKNKMIFTLLMNKMPIRRICEAADVNPKTVYDKINFLHEQCLAFVAHRERKLLDGMPISRLYVGVDRQDYVVNWTRREDKRNVQLTAVGSADNETGYVLGMHLNYDRHMDGAAVEADAAVIADCAYPAPFRQYARAWLACDYEQSVKKSAAAKARTDGSLADEISSAYAEAAAREDVEDFEYPDRTSKLPGKGMQIHAEYTLYAHFFLLRKFFGGAEKVRFFLDQDSGMRAACLGAFQPQIKDRSCDAFYVRINKSLTVDEKQRALADSRKVFRAAKAANAALSDADIKLAMIKDRLHSMAEIGHWKDRWLTHPFPNMSEPEKAICHLTDYGDYDEDHHAWLYNKASMHAIDCFFMQVRRRLSLLERPIASASSARRMWHGYSAYNPESIVKLLEIFRVYFNYCLAGKDGKTPAVRLGLAKGTVSAEDIIYFRNTH